MIADTMMEVAFELLSLDVTDGFSIRESALILKVYLKHLKRHSKRSNSVLRCTHFPIDRVLMKVDKYHKVSKPHVKMV